jgi:hypothetical protein
MPEPTEHEVLCAVCGGCAHQLVPVVVDASPPDFDTRPGDLKPEAWLARCPHCGYCAEDLSSAHAGDEEIVRSAEFRERSEDPRFPALARRFLCYALLVEKAHQWADAGWIWLQAAWVCDDAGDHIAAAQCRERAIDRWKRGKELGQTFADDIASEFAIITDVYRRLGQFEKATVTCAEALDMEDVPAPIEQMLRRQMILIQRRDIARHSMSELQVALKYE